MDQKLLHELVQCIKKLSYREGNFTLSSGKKSTFYIDLKATTLHPEGIYRVSELAVDWLEDQGLKVDAVGGLTLGADPLVTGVSLAAFRRGMILPGLIVRKEPKGHGTSRYIEGVDNVSAGSSILILEDVVTTGASSLKAAERLREFGLNPVATFAVVDREDGGGDAIRQSGLEFFALTTLKKIQSIC